MKLSMGTKLNKFLQYPVDFLPNEHRMKSLGYATFQYKLACFVLAGATAGVAGYLAAVQFGVAE